MNQSLLLIWDMNPESISLYEIPLGDECFGDNDARILVTAHGHLLDATDSKDAIDSITIISHYLQDSEYTDEWYKDYGKQLPPEICKETCGKWRKFKYTGETPLEPKGYITNVIHTGQAL